MARRRTAVGPLDRSRPPPCHSEHRRRRVADEGARFLSRSYWERRRGGKTREYERAPEMTASPVVAAVIISIIQPFLQPAAPPKTRGRRGARIERTSAERKGRRETGAINEDGRWREWGAGRRIIARAMGTRTGGDRARDRGRRGERDLGLRIKSNCSLPRARTERRSASPSPFLRRSVLSRGGRGRREPGEEGRECHRQGKLHRLQTSTARRAR